MWLDYLITNTLPIVGTTDCNKYVNWRNENLGIWLFMTHAWIPQIRSVMRWCVYDVIFKSIPDGLPVGQSHGSAWTVCTINHINIHVLRLNVKSTELNLISIYFESGSVETRRYSCCGRDDTHTHIVDKHVNTVVERHPSGPCNPLGCNLCLCALRLV